MSQKFKIEKRIPIPPKTNRAGSSIYPFKDLKVGDSFLIKEIKDKRKVGIRINMALSRFKKSKEAKGKEYTIRTVNKGIRVWRIK